MLYIKQVVVLHRSRVMGVAGGGKLLTYILIILIHTYYLYFVFVDTSTTSYFHLIFENEQ
jgi:hypothetical protein